MTKQLCKLVSATTMHILSLCPRIRKDAGCIVATTVWRLRVLMLGTLYRQVLVDPQHKSIAINSRYLWLIRRRRTVRFSQIQAITYGYEDWSSDMFRYGSHDSYDCFHVGLRLRDDAELHLFTFLGEGGFTNNGPYPDWVYWSDFALDIVGSQEQESRYFVELLAKITSTSVVPPRM